MVLGIRQCDMAHPRCTSRACARILHLSSWHIRLVQTTTLRYLLKWLVNDYGQGRLIEYHDLIVFEFILRFLYLGRSLRHRMPHVACVDALLT